MTIWLFLTGFLASTVVTLWAVRAAPHLHALAGDHDLSGPQKFHARVVPRVGGVGIMVGLLAVVVFIGVQHRTAGLWSATLLAAALPAFLAGLAEDLTKAQSPRRRLFFTALAAVLASWWVDATITRTDIPGIDWLVSMQWGALLVTVFVVAGVANAVNIIDGFNGLASMCGVLMLAGIAYVAFQVGDQTIGWLALGGAGAVLGFFIWNFPAGLIFLGDGGAYLLGFFIAELGVLLMYRNAAVSPMFPLLLCVYPVFETLFSIYRKKLLRGMSPGVPDGVHLHMLVYKRLMRWAVGKRDARAMTHRNSMTSPYLWTLCSLSVIPAMLWYDSTPILAGFIFLFSLSYIGLYWSIVRFRAPRWLVFRKPRG
jgi:UDP-N-acetylmuramyl pentapeptide phosphotransferase/UDP-N-acetylglucosamine-1-phosphate transferase